jgi:mono/diheme cytochrome c family protein
MATYLKALPATKAPARDGGERAGEQLLAEGRRLYGTHCANCHGADGKGKAPAYPPLAGNRAVTLSPAVNAIRIVLNGGFPPGTAVLTYVRDSWGNKAAPVPVPDVNRYRSVPLD